MLDGTAPENRVAMTAELLIALFVGLSLPVIGAGIALDQGASARNTVLGFAILVGLGVACAGLAYCSATGRRARPRRHDWPSHNHRRRTRCDTLALARAPKDIRLSPSRLRLVSTRRNQSRVAERHGRAHPARAYFHPNVAVDLVALSQIVTQCQVQVRNMPPGTFLAEAGKQSALHTAVGLGADFLIALLADGGEANSHRAGDRTMVGVGGCSENLANLTLRVLRAASRAARPDLVVGALYPVATVLLARTFPRERLTSSQWVGPWRSRAWA